MAIFGAGIATYIPISDGNVDAGASWALVDTVSENDTTGTASGNTYQDTTGSTTSTTSYQKSATWAYASSPPTIDGIAYRINSKTSGGTFSCALDIANVDVTGTTVTCNVADLPNNGWVLFKFASPVTLTIATYSVKFKTSTAGTVAIKSDGSTAHCRLLRTTTTGTAPQNGASQNDNMYIMGEITGAGSVTTRTMTWNITSNTNPFNRIVIGGNAVVNLQNSASTNYFMKVRMDTSIYDTGVLNIGTSGTPVLSTSTFTFTFSPTATIVQGFLVNRGGTLKAYGKTKTTFRTTLVSNVSAAATSISVNAATDWATSDKIAIATTDVTPGHCEIATISSVSGTTIGVGALTNAHLGTSPKNADVINLTRNVVFQGADSTHQFVFGFSTGSTVVLRYVECTLMGTNVSTFSAFYLNADTALGGSIDIQFCSCHDMANNAVTVQIGTANGSITFSNNVCWNNANTYLITGINNVFTGTVTFDNNVFMFSIVVNSLVQWGLSGAAGTGVFTNNALIGSTGSLASARGGIEILGNGNINTTFTGNTIYGGPGYGIIVNIVQTQNVIWTSGSWTVWCMGHGLSFGGELIVCTVNIDGFTAFSNTVANVSFLASVIGSLNFNNFQLQAGTLPACPVGIAFSSAPNNTAVNATIDNSNIGDVTAHSTADLTFAKPFVGSLNFRNSKFGSTTIISSPTNILYGSVQSDRHQQTNGNFAVYGPVGTITQDTTIYDVASPSIRVTPANAGTKITAGQFYLAVPNGDTPTFSIRVRKSKTSSGDAATYNGNQPRLMLAPNPQAVIGLTTLATATSASDGAWETLTGTILAPTGDAVLSIYVDCDGTAGWVNIDTVTTSEISANQGNMGYSRNGQPFVLLGSGTLTYVPIPILRKKVI